MDDTNKLRDWLSHFNFESKLIYQNKEYYITEKEILPLYSKLTAFWGINQNPSSLLRSSLIQKLESKYIKSLPQDKIYELASLVLQIDLEKIIQKVKWQEKYLEWHDGDLHI